MFVLACNSTLFQLGQWEILLLLNLKVRFTCIQPGFSSDYLIHFTPNVGKVINPTHEIILETTQIFLEKRIEEIK